MSRRMAISTLLSAGLALSAVAGTPALPPDMAGHAAGPEASDPLAGIDRANYRGPGVTHRPRWRPQCWTVKRTVRQWNGHRWVKKVVRSRTCRMVRVW